MKKWMMAAAALGLSCGTVQAQGTATQSVVLTAGVTGYCTIDGNATGTGRSATVPVVNGVVTPGPLTIGGINSLATCTSNATIKLTTGSQGLTNTASGIVAPFVNKIHYTATANYNGATENIDTTTAVAGTATTGVPSVGATTNQPLTLTVTILATPSGSFLANGTFSDMLTVTLMPST